MQQSEVVDARQDVLVRSGLSRSLHPLLQEGLRGTVFTEYIVLSGQ
jgi:hypothetical protein